LQTVWASLAINTTLPIAVSFRRILAMIGRKQNDQFNSYSLEQPEIQRQPT